MNIKDAVYRTMHGGMCITLPEFYGHVKLRPNHTGEHFIVSNWDGSNPSKTGWQPSAWDLMRDDWMVAVESTPERMRKSMKKHRQERTVETL